MAGEITLKVSVYLSARFTGGLENYLNAHTTTYSAYVSQYTFYLHSLESKDLEIVPLGINT